MGLLALMLTLLILVSACNSNTDSIVCPYCNAKVAGESLFCQSCGKPLTEESTTASDPTSEVTSAPNSSADTTIITAPIATTSPATTSPAATALPTTVPPATQPSTTAPTATQAPTTAPIVVPTTPVHSHSYSAATCTDPQKCACGATTGTALGHDWSTASCDEHAKCSRCGKTDGKPLGHDWSAASCDEPAKCSRCGKTNGKALGHDWSAASCDEPAKCSRCGKTDGSALGHSYIQGHCSQCGHADPNYQEDIPIESILLSNVSVVILEGESDYIGVSIYPYNATNQALTWESSDPSVVEVDNTGRITSHKPGTAQITVYSTDGTEIQQTCQVMVKAAPILAFSDFPLHLYSNDGKEYLGKLVTNKYDSDSIWNEYGKYGSKYQTDSIWNEYGKYGSKYQSTSAFNPYATKPPIIVTDSGEFVGYLTANEFKYNGYSIIELERLLKRFGQ